MWYIHTIEYYSAIRKKERMPFAATGMGTSFRDYHTKWSNPAPERQNILRYCLYAESKIWYIWIYLQNRNRLTDTEKEHGYQRENVGRVN